MWHLMVYVTGFERDSTELIIILCWSRRYMMSTLNLWSRKDTVKPISDTKPAPPQPGQGCISPENIYTTVWLLGLAPLGTEDKQSNWYLLSTFHIMEISYIYFSTQVFHFQPHKPIEWYFESQFGSPKVRFKFSIMSLFLLPLNSEQVFRKNKHSKPQFNL